MLLPWCPTFNTSMSPAFAAETTFALASPANRKLSSPKVSKTTADQSLRSEYDAPSAGERTSMSISLPDAIWLPAVATLIESPSASTASRKLSNTCVSWVVSGAHTSPTSKAAKTAGMPPMWSA